VSTWEGVHWHMCANVDDLRLRRGGGGGLPSTGRPETKKKAFRESVLESDTPLPPSTGVRIAIYFLRFRPFCARYGMDVRDGAAGGVFQTDDVGQGDSKKSFFARTSLIDDP